MQPVAQSFQSPVAYKEPTAPVVAGSFFTSRESVATVGSEARLWVALAVGSLVVAGLLSLAVVLGRIPFFAAIIDDPHFFRRCLVVHVDLALVVWFYAFLAGLSSISGGNRGSAAGRLALVTALMGVAAMLAGAMVKGAEPVLANYLPVIDHPLFLAGLWAFFLGVVIFIVHSLAGRVSGRSGGTAGLPEDAVTGFQTGGVLVILAVVTWFAARAGLPAGLDAWTRYEFTAWGPGHVLQVANVAMMAGLWFWFLHKATGKPVLSGRAARALFILLAAPHFVMPLLTSRGTLDTLYYAGATTLMRWGIFPVVLVFLALAVRHWSRHRPSIPGDVSPALLTGFVASAGLTVLGFLLGAAIRGSTTLVPAHYHASLGGVTVALMAGAYLVSATAARDRMRPGFWRAARRQLGLFGVGQAVFALGFAWGGIHGLGRKEFGDAEHARSLGEYFGLGIMAVGGLVATAAGLWFLFLMVREMRGWWAKRQIPILINP